jgi:hypothetical protein
MERTKQPNAQWGLPGVWIPFEILYNPGLNSTDKLLYGFIQNLSRTKKGCWASNKWLGGLMGIGPQAVSNAIAKMKKQGIICVEHRPLADGKQERNIFINHQYQIEFEKVIRGEKTLKTGDEDDEIINRGVLEKLYPPIINIIPPYNKNYNPPITTVIYPYNKKYSKEYIKYNNIEVNNNITPSSNKFEDSDTSQDNNSSNIEDKEKIPNKEKNKQYSPIAIRLAEIIKQERNINITPHRIRLWANEIRKLVENDRITPPRLKAALDWYEENIGGEYIPVIESGEALRTKFLRLEDAMKRAGVPPGDSRQSSNNKTKPSPPDRVIRRHFKSKDATQAFYTGCYLPAEQVFYESNSSLDKEKLAQALLRLYTEITTEKGKHIPAEMMSLSPGANTIISDYLEWIQENDWINNKTLDILSIRHSLFSKFRRYEAKKDNKERDPITGKSYMRG